MQRYPSDTTVECHSFFYHLILYSLLTTIQLIFTLLYSTCHSLKHLTLDSKYCLLINHDHYLFANSFLSFVATTFNSQPCMVLDGEIDLEAIAKIGKLTITDKVVIDLCKARSNVTILNLSSCSAITDLALNNIGNHWKHLEEVTLGGCENITHVGVRSLALNCRQLKRISFVNYAIDDAGLRIVGANLMHLEYIDLTGCRKVSDRGLCEIGHCCRKIKTLKLSGCYKICESGIWAVCELVHCEDLRELTLCGCTSMSNQGVVAITRRCPRLQKLHLSRCPYIDAKAVIKAVALGSHLIDIALAETCKHWSNNEIASIIKGIEGRIQCLDLSQCKCLASREMALIARCSEIRDLKLARCRICDDDVTQINKVRNRNYSRSHCLDLLKCWNIASNFVFAASGRFGDLGFVRLSDNRSIFT